MRRLWIAFLLILPMAVGTACHLRSEVSQLVRPAARWARERWDRLFGLSDVLRLYPSEESYRLAERYYTSGDFEKSALQCEKALQLRPGHAAAYALLVEVNFLLGRGQATPVTRGCDRDSSHCPGGSYGQMRLEIQNALTHAKRYSACQEFDAAERELRKVLEYLKWFPDEPECRVLSEEATRWLVYVRCARP